MNSPLQPYLSTERVPVSSGPDANLSEPRVSYHLYLQSPPLQKVLVTLRRKVQREMAEIVAAHFLKMLCMQEGGRVKGCLRRHPFFPLYVLADRVDSPSRSNPLEAALKSLLPVKNKAFLEVGFFFFSFPSRKSKRKEKIST